MSINLSLEDSIAVVTMDNPSKLNVLSDATMNELHEKLFDIERRASVLILAGSGKAFAAGVDVAEIDSRSYEVAHMEDFINSRWERVFNLQIPVIAAVSGYALGGGFELALMCDIIVASRKAVFGFPEVNLGIMPGMGGTQLLTAIVGPKVASEIIMTGEFFSAARALELNIVSQITEDDKLMETAVRLAKKIAQKSSMSTRLIKEAIRAAQNQGLTSGMRMERLMFRSLFSTDSKKSSVRDFLRKKKR
ncbi:MAG: enoyl-CoA hydratase/isomerase family protein [Holosporaceae bacterium]|jgi:enoyl-CoA hydratase/carnithine racemase|nr:enoyl-CoA hydratase/isomerase family protein [Holosporaceae bacterium]